MFLNYSDSHNTYQSENVHFSKLLNEFRAKIYRIASTFPKTWYDDFVQEGFIALNKALHTFNDKENPNHFYPYAIHAIRTAMIDFYRSKFVRYPNCIDASDIVYDDEDSEHFIQQIKDPTNWALIPELKLDFQKHLSNDSLRRKHFTEKEIRIFELFFIEDQSLTKIAADVEFSVSQVSKKISKIKTKLQKYFS